MKHLSIDIETYSSVDIRKSEAYKHAESEDFEILLFARNRNLTGRLPALRRDQSAQGHSAEQPALPRPVLRRREHTTIQPAAEALVQ